jgi:hypothetical protein
MKADTHDHKVDVVRSVNDGRAVEPEPGMVELPLPEYGHVLKSYEEQLTMRCLPQSGGGAA